MEILGLFYVALDHMLCDVVDGGRGGVSYLDSLLRGGEDGPAGASWSGQAVGNGRAFRRYLRWG
jgi:hypothetical protein